MKTNIKMRVMPEQSRRVQEICFENSIEWSISKKNISNIRHNSLFISNSSITYGNSNGHFKAHDFIEIDADLFIRTNGACEEQTNYKEESLKSKGFNISNISNHILKATEDEKNILEQKLKKKNEILKKARIKRKNQREELHKLNLKLQKCISLEKHNKKIESIEFDLNMFKSSNKLRGDLIEKLELENTEMCKRIENINKDNANYLSNNILSRDKEIEKLKAVIEYLESKTK